MAREKPVRLTHAQLVQAVLDCARELERHYAAWPHSHRPPALAPLLAAVRALRLAGRRSFASPDPNS